MDQIWEFIKGMTIWNWISLCSFLVLPFSGFNLYFNLFPRFKDWKATKSRKRFEGRLIQHEARFKRIKGFRDTHNLATTALIENLTTPVRCLILGLLFLSYALLFYTSFSLSTIALYIAQICFWQMWWSFTRFSKDIRAANSPSKFVLNTIKLINKGKSKGVMDAENYEFVEEMVNSWLFTDYGKNLLINAVTHKSPKMLEIQNKISSAECSTLN